MNKAIHRFIFFVGWLLSPLTAWNDILINIPLAYIFANITVFIWPFNFLATTIAWYWLTNAIGLIMMAASGQSLFRDRKNLAREAVILAVTIALYSVVLIALHFFGILKPLPK